MLAIVSNKGGINWGAKNNDRIAQNIRNLINTHRYEVAFNRTMGISPDLIDRPTNIAMERIKVDIAEIIARYEPRVALESIECTANSKGELEIKVAIEIA